ncbi:hypothetical protein Pmani_034920 [Petrolisthes manimaculis]|uniref:Uncharacterized protein n=1 Tax=Petrolisthes manimaculis TaxID=1843537 RepID=A0AAE1NNE2_9EUCA|nr:hypothetical protein Pmani_034920 [Petrolisthes manimaculis]
MESWRTDEREEKDGWAGRLDGKEGTSQEKLVLIVPAASLVALSVVGPGGESVGVALPHPTLLQQTPNVLPPPPSHPFLDLPPTSAPDLPFSSPNPSPQHSTQSPHTHPHLAFKSSPHLSSYSPHLPFSIPYTSSSTPHLRPPSSAPHPPKHTSTHPSCYTCHNSSTHLVAVKGEALQFQWLIGFTDPPQTVTFR